MTVSEGRPGGAVIQSRSEALRRARVLAAQIQEDAPNYLQDRLTLLGELLDRAGAQEFVSLAP